MQKNLKKKEWNAYISKLLCPENHYWPIFQKFLNFLKFFNSFKDCIQKYALTTLTLIIKERENFENILFETNSNFTVLQNPKLYSTFEEENVFTSTF